MNLKYCLLLVIALTFAACAGVGGRPTYPVAITPDIQKAWNNAEALYQAKRIKKPMLHIKRSLNPSATMNIRMMRVSNAVKYDFKKRIT